MAPPQGAVAALMAAYFANEIGAEYGLLSQAHYDMTHECLQRRQRAKTGSALTAEQEEAIGQAATRTMVAQSTLAAVLEFCLAQLAGQLSDAVGRRPILVAASLLMAVCKAVPALRPSVPGVWAAKAGGEALNTICTNALLSSVSDLFADSVQAYGATAGRLRALGGFAWMVGPLLGGWMGRRFGSRLPYAVSTVSAVALSGAALLLPETSQRSVGFRAAVGELSWGSVVPLGWVSLFARRGAYSRAAVAVPRLALTLALQRLVYFGTYDVQDGHTRSVLGWGSARLSHYRVVEGTTDFLQGALAEVTLSRLGFAWGALLGNVAAAGGFLVQALSVPAGWRKHLMWVGVGFLSLPAEAAPEALLVNAASAAGVGEGALQSDLSNLTALMKMAGPPFLGQAYFVGSRRGWTSAWGWAAAAGYLGAQLVFMTRPRSG